MARGRVDGLITLSRKNRLLLRGLSAFLACLMVPSPASADVISMVSRYKAGEQANGRSYDVSLSGDGRYVLFTTEASNLNSNSLAGIHLGDMLDGRLRWLHPGSNAYLSANGTYAAFVDRENGTDSYVRVNLLTGTTNAIAQGAAEEAPQHRPVLTPDGQYAVVVARPDGQTLNIGLVDIGMASNTWVSRSWDGSSAGHANSDCDGPAVSADRQFVLFRSAASNLVPGIHPAGVRQIYLRDVSLATNRLISQTTNGLPVTSDCSPPAISGDGRYAAFTCADSNLVSADSNTMGDTFVYSIGTGGLTRISLNDASQQATGASAFGDMLAAAPSISHDGRYVLFASSATNLDAGDTNDCVDLFLRDTASNTTVRVSNGVESQPATGPTQAGMLSSNGQYAAFASGAGNLAGFDFNLMDDVFHLNRNGWPIMAAGQGGSAVLGVGVAHAQGGGFADNGLLVNVASRNLHLELPLFTMTTPGPTLSLTLHYNSNPSVGASFGRGWSLTPISQLRAYEEALTMRYGSGREQTFTKASTDGSWTHFEADAPSRDTADMFMAGFGSLFSAARGLTYSFFPAHAISDSSLKCVDRIVDRNSNTFNLSWKGTGPGGIYAIMVCTNISDPAGREVLLDYDEEGRCTRIRVPDDANNHPREVLLTVDAQTNLVSLTDMAGYVTTFQYDSEGYLTRRACGARWTEFEYDSPGFGALKRVIRIRDDTGESTYSGGGGIVLAATRSGRAFQYESNPAGQMTRITSPLGASSTIDYGGGYPTARTDPMDNKSLLSWNGNGMLASVADPYGKSVDYSYASCDLVTPDGQTNTYRYPSTIDPPGGGAVSLAYNGVGDLTAVDTAGGSGWDYVRSTNGRVTSVTDPRSKTRNYAYDAKGRLTTIADALGKTTTFTYDTKGRCSRITDARGKYKDLSYDANDRLTRITYTTAPGSPYVSLAYDAFDLVSMTDELGNQTLFQHNGLSQVTRVTPPLGNAVQGEYDLDGNRITTVNPRGRKWRTTYDADGRPTVKIRPSGAMVEMVYDAAGNLTTLADENGNDTQMTYDDNNRVASIKDPLLHSVTFTRDDAGRITTVQNARGQTVDRTYDTDGRLTALQLGATAYSYTYDAAGNVLTGVDPLGTTTFTYSDRNEVLSISYPDGKGMSFTYDDVGNVASMTYPNGVTATYAYDDFCRIALPPKVLPRRASQHEWPADRPNQPVSITWETTRSILYALDSKGRITGATRSNGTATEIAYDANGRITSLVHKRGSVPFTAQLLGYNEANQVLSETLTHAIAPTLTTHVATAAYDAANQVGTWDGESATYDLDGNLTARGTGFTATYTAENRLATKTVNGTNTQYQYDAFGNMVRKTTGGVETRYYHDRNGRLLFVANSSGTILHYCLYRGSELVAIGPKSDYRFLHSSANGSVLALTDEGGSTLETYAYDPYGQVTRSSSPGTSPFTFVGAAGVLDEGDGQFLMRNRHYDSILGRFLQRDPLGHKGGAANLYQYAGDNPMLYIDPQGTFFFIAAAVIVGIGLVYGSAQALSETAQAGLDRTAAWQRMTPDQRIQNYHAEREHDVNYMGTVVAQGAELYEDVVTLGVPGSKAEAVVGIAADAVSETFLDQGREEFRSSNSGGMEGQSAPPSLPGPPSPPMETITDEGLDQ